MGGSRFLLPVAKGKGVAFRAYDAMTGKPSCTVDLGDDVVGAWRYALSADGRRLAVIPDRIRNRFPRDMGPEMWNLNTGVREGKLPPGEPHADGGQSFDPGSSRLVTWRTGSVAVWDVATREKLREFKLSDGGFRHAALTADGKLLATDSAIELAVWDADTGANVFRLAHPDGSCDGIAFVADGNMLLVDSLRRGWSALDLYPTDAAAHFGRLGLRRLTDRERLDHGLTARPGSHP
jgi:WD40 repeat protein